MTSAPQTSSTPANATIPTWKLTALMIRNQWKPYMLHALFGGLHPAEWTPS
jgi:hypothetical protein